MKKTILTILAGAGWALASCAQPAPSGNYSLSVTFPAEAEADDYMAYIVDVDNGAKIDSVIVADNKALFSGKIDKPVLARVMLENDRVGTFILEPADIVFDPATKEAKGGTLNAKMDDINKKFGEVVSRFRALPRDSTFEAKAEALQAEYEKLNADALKENADNPIGYYLFINMAGSLDEPQLDEALKQYPQFASSQKVAGFKKMFAQRRETSVGQPYKDFAVTFEGKTTKLSEMLKKGRYTLVDFWASWCGPCRRETAVIKDLLKEYGPKGLDVVGVAVWDEPDNTRKAIEELALPWPQILNAQSVPTELYGIAGIPTIIIIDPDGKIVSRDKQDEELRADVAACFPAE